MCMYSTLSMSAAERMMLADEVGKRGKEEKRKQRGAQRIANAIYKELPYSVQQWAKGMLPNAMFYIKEGRGKYRAYCSACGERVELSHARSGRTIECPHCSKTVVLKSGTRSPYGCGFWKACAYIERVTEGWVQRLFIARKYIDFKNEKISVHYSFDEEERDVLFSSASNADYSRFHENSMKEGSWIAGAGRVHGMGWTGWRICQLEPITYPMNLKELFCGSRYAYSAIEEALQLVDVNPFDYLYEYAYEPKLEMISKLGLVGLLREYCTDKSWGRDEKKSRIRKIKNLKDIGIDSINELEECRGLGIYDLVARKEIKQWRIEEAEYPIAMEFIKGLNSHSGEDFSYTFISRERLFRYYLTQQSFYAVGDFIRDYIDDYIPDCIKLGLNMKDTAICAPKDLETAHRWSANEVKVQKTQVYDAMIEAFYTALHRLVEWRDDKFRIIMPKTSREIVEEGARQNHCVGRYCERVAHGESVILFVRRIEEPEKAFYTLEIKKDMKRCDIVQCRGYGNAALTDEMKGFLEKYQRWFNRRPIKGYDGDQVMARYYKAVHKRNGRYISNFDGKTEFVIGEWMSFDTNGDPDAVAVEGIHLASLEFAQNFGNRWKDVAILEIETNIHDVVVPDAKDQVRTSRLRVLREVPMDEMGEWGKAHSRAAA